MLATLSDAAPELSTSAGVATTRTAEDRVPVEQPSWSVADMIALATTQVSRQPAMLRAARARATNVREQAAVALASSPGAGGAFPLDRGLEGGVAVSGGVGAENARSFEVRY
jgi:hypothetical protein